MLMGDVVNGEWAMVNMAITCLLSSAIYHLTSLILRLPHFALSLPERLNSISTRKIINKLIAVVPATFPRK